MSQLQGAVFVRLARRQGGQGRGVSVSCLYPFLCLVCVRFCVLSVSAFLLDRAFSICCVCCDDDCFSCRLSFESVVSLEDKLHGSASDMCATKEVRGLAVRCVRPGSVRVSCLCMRLLS